MPTLINMSTKPTTPTKQAGNFRARKGDRNAVTHRFAISISNPGVERPVKEGCGWRIEAAGRTENRVEDITGDTNEFDTFLIPVLQEGTYFEIHPDPNLHRTGYCFTGAVVIGPDHIGNITIPLYKFREGDDLELPTTIGRMFLRVEQEEQLFCDMRPMQTSDQTSFGNISYPSSGAVPSARSVPQARGGGNSMW